MEKRVVITFPPFPVIVKGKTNEEILINAQKAVIEKMKEAFPEFTYNITAINKCKKSQEYFPGVIVQTIDGIYGIITCVGIDSVNIALSDYTDTTLKKRDVILVDDVAFEDVRRKRMPAASKWKVGDSGYFVSGNGVHEVIISRIENKRYKLSIINSNGRYFNVSEHQLKSLYDEKPA